MDPAKKTGVSPAPTSRFDEVDLSDAVIVHDGEGGKTEFGETTSLEVENAFTRVFVPTGESIECLNELQKIRDSLAENDAFEAHILDTIDVAIVHDANALGQVALLMGSYSGRHLALWELVYHVALLTRSLEEFVLIYLQRQQISEGYQRIVFEAQEKGKQPPPKPADPILPSGVLLKRAIILAIELFKKDPKRAKPDYVRVLYLMARKTKQPGLMCKLYLCTTIEPVSELVFETLAWLHASERYATTHGETKIAESIRDFLPYYCETFGIVG